MSIINDALKKTAELIQQNTNPQLPKSAKPAEKRKNLLLYLLIIIGGLFLGNLALNLLAHKAKPETMPPKPQEVKAVTPEIKTTALTQTEQAPSAISNVVAAKPAPEEKMNETDFVLSGIFFSDAEKYVLLNNQILKEGDTIKGATVKNITTNAVELDRQGQSIIISTGNK